MAADVMMGNDAHCAAWIARYREQSAGRADERTTRADVRAVVAHRQAHGAAP